jgi:hypothetical protein
MNTYGVKLEIMVEVEAFDESDALDYANDIFGIDDEIKNVKVVSVKEK